MQFVRRSLTNLNIYLRYERRRRRIQIPEIEAIILAFLYMKLIGFFMILENEEAILKCGEIMVMELKQNFWWYKKMKKNQNSIFLIKRKENCPDKFYALFVFTSIFGCCVLLTSTSSSASSPEFRRLPFTNHRFFPQTRNLFQFP